MPSRPVHIAIGQTGEDLAANFLYKKGLIIIARNVQTPIGEIDILAKDKKTIVVVEVKTMHGKTLNSPLEEITSAKLNKLQKLAELIARDTSIRQIRVDVVGVNLSNTEPQFMYVPNITI